MHEMGESWEVTKWRSISSNVGCDFEHLGYGRLGCGSSSGKLREEATRKETRKQIQHECMHFDQRNDEDTANEIRATPGNDQ